MQRSEINEIIRQSDAFIRSFGYVMPPFAYWSPEEMKKRTADDAAAIRAARLGWDITDYGQGKFADLGLFLFTVRNGHAEDLKRGGGALVLELFNSLPDGSVDEETDVTVATDGRTRTLKAGGHLKLNPGESVTLLPGCWHAFWGEGGDVLIGEVSTVNDDLTDNIFRDPIGRFSTVEENEQPLHLLVSDYDNWL